MQNSSHNIETQDCAWQKIYDQLGITIPEFEDRTLASYVHAHADKFPNAPALQYFTKTISYKEYDTLANQVANGLKAVGVKKGDIVGLHMPNIPQYAITLVALSKIGAIGTGMSPLLAPPELTHQLANAGVKVLLSLADLNPVLSAMKDVPACLETLIICGAGDFLGAAEPKMPMKNSVMSNIRSMTFHALKAGQSDLFTAVNGAPDDIAMIQYTGGTTGRPKGAQLTIRTLMHNPAQVGLAEPKLTVGQEVYASAFPFFHVAGLSFLLGAARYGGHLFLIPNPRDTDSFCDLLIQFPPTRLASVPALYDMLLANPRFKTVDFSKLKVAKTGAAPMTEMTRSALEAVIGKDKLSDVFGMTETGPCYTMHPLKALKRGSVGIPVPGAQVKIMDAETGTQEMPFGEPGEICSTGPQTMKGYLNLADETANALRPMDGKLWMYSGDIGYMDSDGYIFICDRAKDMLVVGGYKVFSVEVEDKLKSHPMIAESAVIGVADEKRPGNDIVHLYVELTPEHTSTDAKIVKNSILGFMRETMAAYKIPKHIEIIEAIPLTPVGKIDKKALRTA